MVHAPSTRSTRYAHVLALALALAYAFALAAAAPAPAADPPGLQPVPKGTPFSSDESVSNLGGASLNLGYTAKTGRPIVNLDNIPVLRRVTCAPDSITLSFSSVTVDEPTGGLFGGERTIPAEPYYDIDKLWPHGSLIVGGQTRL
eukprot:tig00000145_g8853.t1